METKTAEELSNLDSSQLLFKLDEAREAAREAGYAWAEAEKKFKDSKELLPSILAEITSAHMTGAMKMNEAKLRAIASPEYKAKVKEMNVLEYEARLVKVQYQGWMKSLEVLAAIGFLRNNEIQLSR
jgi:hypothetical protein